MLFRGLETNQEVKDPGYEASHSRDPNAAVGHLEITTRSMCRIGWGCKSDMC